MSKILVVDDEPEVVDLTCMLIETDHDVEIVTASSGNEAIEILRKDSDISIVLSDYSMANGNGAFLYNTMNEENIKKPFALLTGGYLEDYDELKGFDLESPFNYYLNKPYSEADFSDMLRKMLKQAGSSKPEGLDELVNASLKRVRIGFLKSLYTGNVDIFVKLTNNKFVKVVHTNDMAKMDDFKKYEDKGETHLYINEKDIPKFVEHIFKKISLEIKNAKDIKDTASNISKGMKALQCTLNLFGIDKYQKEMIDASVDKCIEQLTQNKSLLEMVKLFKEDKAYLSSHSLIALHISYVLCDKLGLANNQILTKFSYAALLHDITLEKKNLSQVISVNDSCYKDLDGESQQAVLDHPKQAAGIVLKLKNISQDVFDIIVQHHERPDGSGFPEGSLSSRITPLSAIFIIGLEVAHHLYFHGEEKLDELKLELNERYDKDHFKRPLMKLLGVLN